MVAENDSDLQTLTCDLGNIKFYFVNTPCMSAMRFLDSCAVTLILSKHSFGFVIDSNSITIDRDLPESLVKPPRSTSSDFPIGPGITLARKFGHQNVSLGPFLFTWFSTHRHTPQQLQLTTSLVYCHSLAAHIKVCCCLHLLSAACLHLAQVY